MTKQMMCAVALGCATLVGGTAVKAQGADQDKQFLMTASQSDYTEMTFSKLAEQKSTNASVKAYAQKMITDHTKLEADMKPFADQMGVTPVTTLDATHQQLYDQMSSLSGTDFDKAYMSAMDTDHHASLDAFKAEEASTTNASLKPVVKKGEKVVAQHTEMADKMSKRMGGNCLRYVTIS